MKNKKHITIASLSNATELGSLIVKKIVGNEASDQVGGKLISENIKDTLAAKLSKRLMINGGAK